MQLDGVLKKNSATQIGNKTKNLEKYEEDVLLSQ